MHRTKTNFLFVTCFFMALTLYGCGGSGGGQSQSTPVPVVAKVSLSPSSATLGVGATFNRTVEVQNIGNTFYAGFDLTYDPNVIQYLDRTEGGFLNKSGADPTAVEVALQNGQPGRITVGLTRLGAIGEVSGNGTLLTLSFKAVGAGTTTLTFENPKGFKNSSNQDVVIDTWENGTVTVQ